MLQLHSLPCRNGGILAPLVGMRAVYHEVEAQRGRHADDREAPSGD